MLAHVRSKEVLTRAGCSTNDEKYFLNGELRWPELATSTRSRHFVASMKSLQVCDVGSTAILMVKELISTRRHMPLFDLMQKIFTYDPARRITAAEALQHPFFSEDYSDKYRCPPRIV